MNWKFWKGWFEDGVAQNENLASEIHLDSKESKFAKLFVAIVRKHAGDFAMIPENLDLDKHIEQFPLINYKFRKKRETDVIYSNKGIKFDKDRLAYLIGLISSIPASDKDSITEDGYVKIYSKYIQNFFPDYKCYLDYLINTGVIISNGHYEIGKHSIGYKFAPHYENVGLVKYVYHRNIKDAELSSTAVPAQTFNKDTNTLEAIVR